MIHRILLAAGTLLASLCLAPAALAQSKASQIPLETFLRRFEFRELALSPNGRYLAAISPTKGRYNLAIIDLEKRSLNRITGFDNTDVVGFQWLTDERITFGIGDTLEAAGQARFRGRYLVDVDGTRPNRVDEKIPGFRVVATETGVKDEVIIAARLRMRDFEDLYRYNVRTGERKMLTFDSPGNVTGWIVDRGFVPRVAYGRESGRTVIWYREGEGAKWTPFWEGDADESHPRPVAFGWDGTMYVSSDDGRETRAVYKWDFAKKALGELVAAHDQADVGLIFDVVNRKLLGFAAQADEPFVKWLDADMARLQSLVDQSLPGRRNTLIRAARNPTRMAVFSRTDRDPGEYLLFDPVKLTMEKAAPVAEWIKPDLMSERKAVRYKARDGLEIPAYLTIPKESSGKNLPLVLQVHGGPNVRGETWGFDPVDQMLAAQGYVVLSPNFRGSTGIGKTLYRKGFKQWGLAMQDDLVDGVEWLVRQGIVDPKRVCIYGGSYGGYATLYGVARDPDLYRCGVATVAVSDIGLLFDVTWSDTAQDRTFRFLDFEAKYRIGDPDKDKEQFRKTSAVEQAANIKAPLLLAYGGADVRVPLIHGDRMRSALDTHGKAYEWVVYPDEGHGFNQDDNRRDFYTRMLAFLRKHLQ